MSHLSKQEAVNLYVSNNKVLKNFKKYLIYAVYGALIVPFALIFLLNQAFEPLAQKLTITELGQVLNH
jgi:hypothetical protein